MEHGSPLTVDAGSFTIFACAGEYADVVSSGAMWVAVFPEKRWQCNTSCCSLFLFLFVFLIFIPEAWDGWDTCDEWDLWEEGRRQR